MKARTGSRWGVAVLIAAIAALASLLGAALPAGAAGPGSGSYKFGAGTYQVPKGGYVDIPVIGSNLVMGGGGHTNLCYTISKGTADNSTFNPGTGALSFTLQYPTQYIRVQASAAAIATQTIKVQISSPCYNNDSLTNDTGSITAPAEITVEIVEASATIGTVQFSATTYPITEGSVLNIPVTRTGGSNGAIDAICSTAAGGTASNFSDYTWTSWNLHWNSGDSTTKYCTMSITQDFTPEGTETAIIQLSSAQIGTPSTATVSISDTGVSGLPQFAQASYTVNENAGNAIITLTRGAIGTQVTVACSTVAGGTANPVTNYQPITTQPATFLPFSGTATCTVPIYNTHSVFTPLTVNLQLTDVSSGGLGPRTSATLSIVGAGSPVATITSVSPPSGPTYGGQQVTIYGTNLSGASNVVFGNTAACNIVSISYSSIICNTTAHIEGTVSVVATVSAGIAVGTNVYTYGEGPVITGLSPDSGPASASPVTFVTITGTNFTGATSVRFGGTSANFTVLDDDEIRAILPAHAAGTVDVTVTTPAGTSPNTVLDDFTYIGAVVPSVTGVSPSSGKVGAVVTISGSGFTDATSVTFGGVSATFTVNSNTSISATVPSGTPLGTVDVRVSNVNGTSANTSADNFTNTTSTTTSYTLYFRWTLVAWNGADNISIASALQGSGSGTNSIYNQVTSVWLFDGPTQKFKGWFPGSESIPGAADITTFRKGQVYWIAISTQGSITWTIVQG